MSKKKEEFKMKSWYSNKYQLVVVQRNILSLFTLMAMAAVIVATIFVKQITSSKSLEPYVIELEEKTGIPTVVDQVTLTQLTANMSVKKYFLYLFLNAVEGYSPLSYKEDYKRAMLFSTPYVFRAIRTKINIKNANSPAAKISSKGKIIIKIKSFQFLQPNLVQIRMRIEPVGRTSGFSVRNVVTYVRFRFANLNLTTAERYINPLGFQITEYKVTDELIATP